MLCDFAQVSEGKLTIVGGGWNELRRVDAPMSLAALLHLPWQERPRDHSIVIDLLDADGRAVVDQNSGSPVRVEANLSVAGGDRRADRVGVSVPVPFACMFAPLGLMNGNRYVWRLTIDGETSEEWQAAFLVDESA